MTCRRRHVIVNLMPPIIIVDTSVLLNVLNVPGFNQHRDAVLSRFRELVEARANLLLPMGAVFETGNHIAHLPDGQQRRWVPFQFPDARQPADWLEGFPEYAMRGIGMVDLSIIKAWERTCAQHPAHRVEIWALDQHLTGYDRIP